MIEGIAFGRVGQKRRRADMVQEFCQRAGDEGISRRMNRVSTRASTRAVTFDCTYAARPPPG